MSVKELIELLAQYDGDSQVVINDSYYRHNIRTAVEHKGDVVIYVQ